MGNKILKGKTMGMERGIIMLDHHPIICFVYFQAHGSTKSKPPNEVGHHLLNYHLFLHLVHLVHYLVHCTRTLRTGLNNKKKCGIPSLGCKATVLKNQHVARCFWVKSTLFHGKMRFSGGQTSHFSSNLPCCPCHQMQTQMSPAGVGM